jgi:tetratricopeptide (TPR) repeat protein
MVRRTVTLFVVLLGVGYACDVAAQQGDGWNVRSDAKRERKIVERYTQVLLKHPDRALLVRQLIAKVGTGARLDAVIDRVRGEAERHPDEAEPRILLGHLLGHRGRSAAALKAYRSAVQVEPDDAEAHSALGLAYGEAGRPKKARRAFERAVELQTSDRKRRELLRRLADLAMTSEKPDEAVRWFEQLVDERPHDGDLRVEFAELLARAHRFERAAAQYRAALERVGRNGKSRAMILRDLGSLQRRMHDPVAAADYYRKALRLTARRNWMRRELWTRLVDAHREMNRLPEVYEELTSEWRRPGYAESMQLASLADEIGLAEQATKWLERAARLDRRALEPRTRLIARLEMGGDQDRVRAIYDEILRIRPDDVVHRIELAEWMYFRRQQPKRAMTMLRDAEERWAEEPGALVELAGAWGRFGVTEEALRLHRRVAELEPRHVNNLEAWGELRARLGDLDGAKRIWGRLLGSESTELRARLRLAELLLRVGEAEEAIEHLERVVAEHPDVPDLRQRLASTYERAKRWDRAIAEWEHLFFEGDIDHAARRVVAIVDRTYDSQTLARWEERWESGESLRVGVVVARMRKVLHRVEPGPIEIVAEIARRDPADLDARQRLSWAHAVDMLVEHLQTYDPVEAIAWLKKLGETFGDRRVMSARQIVDIAFTMEPSEAKTHFEYAVRVAPNDAYVRAQAGNFFGVNGDADRAIAHLNRAIELGPSGFEPYFDLVHYLTEKQREDEAREVLLTVVARDRTGKAAVSAALAALDLCHGDSDVMAMERRVRRLRGRIPVEGYRTIMIGVYQNLFVYSDDAEVIFEKLGARAFPTIVDAVQSRQLDVRERAADLTALYADEAVLARARRYWSTPWNEEMAWVIARMKRRQAAGFLAEALEADQETVRHVAMLGLVETVGPESRKPLFAALRPDQTVETRVIAAMVLGGLGGAKVVDRLAELAAADDEEQVRVAATWALGRTGEARAANALRERLRDPAERVARAASWSLASLRNDAGVRALFEAYWGPSESARARAERGLRIGPEDLVRGLSLFGGESSPFEPATLVRETLSRAVDAPAKVPISWSFREHSSTIASVAGERLERTEWRQKVLEDLVRITDAAPDGDRPGVAAVVGELRPRLRRLVREEGAPVVYSAALLLPHAGDPQDVEVVVAAATRLEPAEGAQVVDRLSRYPWAAVREPLLEAARSESDARRRASLQAIARSKRAASDAPVLEIVKKATREASPEVRIAAIEALGALGHDASTDDLVEMFEEADYRTRIAILGSLESMGTERARSAAKELLVVPIERPCQGDPDDLSDLLADDCTGVFDVPDF